MPRTARRPSEWLTLGGGALTAAIWASNGGRAVMADVLVTQALFACVAFTIAGMALGVVLSVLVAPRRARQRQEGPGGITFGDMTTPFLLLGLTMIGGSSNPVFDASAGAWSWVSLVVGAALGACFLVRSLW